MGEKIIFPPREESEFDDAYPGAILDSDDLKRDAESGEGLIGISAKGWVGIIGFIVTGLFISMSKL